MTYPPDPPYIGPKESKMNNVKEITKLEMQRIQIHDYVSRKLNEHDYRAILISIMNLIEIETEIDIRSEYESKSSGTNSSISK